MFGCGIFSPLETAMLFPSRVKERSKPREQKPQRRLPPSPCSEVVEQTQAPLPLPP